MCLERGLSVSGAPHFLSRQHMPQSVQEEASSCAHPVALDLQLGANAWGELFLCHGRRPQYSVSMDEEMTDE